MTFEAVALYCLDNLDAKVNAFQQLLRDDPNVDSTWTAFYPNLDPGSCSRGRRWGRRADFRFISAASPGPESPRSFDCGHCR